jgi:hypothetical protein
MQVELSVKIEISDHDGYCSGNECDYIVKTERKVVNVPDTYKDLKVKVGDEITEHDWTKETEDLIPQLNITESYYCNNSEKSIENGLMIHDYRMTVLSAIIIDAEEEDNDDQWI